MVLRKKRYIREHELEDVGHLVGSDTFEDSPARQIPARVNLERAVAIKEICAKLRMNRVESAQLHAFLLHSQEGLSDQEVADTQQVGLGAAKTRIRRGRLALKAQLKKLGIDCVPVFKPQHRPGGLPGHVV